MLPVPTCMALAVISIESTPMEDGPKWIALPDISLLYTASVSGKG